MTALSLRILFRSSGLSRCERILDGDLLAIDFVRRGQVSAPFRPWYYSAWMSFVLGSMVRPEYQEDLMSTTSGLHADRILVGGLVLFAFSSCVADSGAAGDDCAQLTLLRGETGQPAVVKLFLTARSCDGEPLAGLTPEQFVVQEDGEEISTYESEQNTVKDPRQFRLVTVLLLDMSGSIVASGNLP